MRRNLRAINPPLLTNRGPIRLAECSSGAAGLPSSDWRNKPVAARAVGALENEFAAAHRPARPFVARALVSDFLAAAVGGDDSDPRAPALRRVKAIHLPSGLHSGAA